MRQGIEALRTLARHLNFSLREENLSKASAPASIQEQMKPRKGSAILAV